MNNKEDPESHQLLRICKQCGITFRDPLHHDGKLWLFCCLYCKEIWDEQREALKFLRS